MKMKKLVYFVGAVMVLFSASSCQSMVDGINDNPNSISTDKIDAGLYMNTPEINLVDIQRGLFSELSALWSGQLIGVNQTPLAYYNYLVTESTFSFEGYQSIIEQALFIQKQAPENKLYQGMTRVMEAMLFGTYASFYGDVPCKEVCSDIDSPVFDSQKDVFAYVQNLLDEAIVYLSTETTPSYRQDYLYSGSVTKWLECAYSLKARYYMLTKNYADAYTNAQKGFSSDTNSMYFVPVNDKLTDNKNHFYERNTTLQGYSTKDLNGKQCYMFDLMDGRTNVKTDETARKAYYTINPSSPETNYGISAKLQKEPVITYLENLLTLAEAGARSQGFTIGLQYLNKARAFLNGGGCVNDYFKTLSYKYKAYDESDFADGGLLNKGHLEPLRALLREIILERYVSGFTTFIPFDDARRLRGTSETDIALDIPLNTTSVDYQPERCFYPESEMLSNVNAPVDLGLYQKTPVNSK